MRRKRLPIFHKVSNLLRIFVAKMRKPTIPKLILIKKSRKRRRFKLLKHYNGFLEEYEFSPSSTSLAHHPRKQFKFRSYKDNIYTMLFLCRCLGGLKADQLGGEGRYRLSMDSTLPVATISTGDFLEPLDYLVDEEDSVDQRAERFIERFYQDMRLQRQESIQPFTQTVLEVKQSYLRNFHLYLSALIQLFNVFCSPREILRIWGFSFDCQVLACLAKILIFALVSIFQGIWFK